MRRTAIVLLGIVAVTWIAYTLYAVLRYGGAVVLDLETTSRIMSVRNGEEIHSAVGLTYHGLWGALLVVGEVVIVATATLIGLFGKGWPRGVGFGILVGWNALWLANVIWLRSRGWDNSSEIWLIGAVMLATVAWAGLLVRQSLSK